MSAIEYSAAIERKSNDPGNDTHRERDDSGNTSIHQIWRSNSSAFMQTLAVIVGGYH
jgi:hypothetical protein